LKTLKLDLTIFNLLNQGSMSMIFIGPIPTR